MVSDLSTALGFLALVAMKLLSSNLCCALPPTICYKPSVISAVFDGS